MYMSIDWDSTNKSEVLSPSLIWLSLKFMFWSLFAFSFELPDGVKIIAKTSFEVISSIVEETGSVLSLLCIVSSNPN